ncbi:MAG: zinc metalloprotease [Cuniculiplasma sp.]
MDFFNLNLQRYHSQREEFIVSILVFGLALSVAYSRIFAGITSERFLLILLPVGLLSSLISIGSSFAVKKYVSQRYGYKVHFTIYTIGLILTLLTSIFGFIISLPGSARLRNINNREIEGKISLSSPVTNMILGLIFISTSFFTSGMIKESLDIFSGSNLVVAFFSLFPFPPLDGYSILKWNFYLYLVSLAFSITFIVIIGHGFI